MRTLSYFVHSNLWIALGAPALIAVSCMEWDRPFPSALGVAAFCFVLLSYNLQRWVRLMRPRGEGRPVTFFSTRVRSVFLSIAAIASLSVLFFLSARTLFVLIPLALLSLFYAMPLFGSGKGLRDLPYLKVFLIALSWAYLSVPVTAVALGVSMAAEGWLLFIERGLFVFAITIPFDIRDLPYDDADERSFPQVLGVKGAKGLALSALSAFLVIALIRLWSGDGQAPMILGYTVTAILSGLLIAASDVKKPNLYYEGLLDGTMLLMALLLFLFDSLL